MKKAAIIIDEWKLPIFKEHLDDGGFKYEEYPGPNKGQILIQAQCNTIPEIAPLVTAANIEAARFKASMLH